MEMMKGYKKIYQKEKSETINEFGRIKESEKKERTFDGREMLKRINSPMPVVTILFLEVP